jgi:hypothetical protein
MEMDDVRSLSFENFPKCDDQPQVVTIPRAEYMRPYTQGCRRFRIGASAKKGTYHGFNFAAVEPGQKRYDVP